MTATERETDRVARLERTIAECRELLRRERCENERLDAENARLNRKIAHGCVDAACVGCDRTEHVMKG